MCLTNHPESSINALSMFNAYTLQLTLLAAKAFLFTNLLHLCIILYEIVLQSLKMLLFYVHVLIYITTKLYNDVEREKIIFM